MLIDLKPSGEHYMEHFHHAGGVPKLMAQLGDLIDLDAKTITGATLRDVVAAAEEVPGQDAIRPRNNPIKPEGAMAVLHGNLAPRGAVIKHSAASPKLLQHTGRAVVFESVEDMTCGSTIPRSMSPPTTCWCCAMPAPRARRACRRRVICRSRRKLVARRRQGHGADFGRADERDGVRHHRAAHHPESAVGGPLALVRNGDMIRLDVETAHRLLVEPRSAKTPGGAGPVATPDWAKRGYAHLFNETILQADEGCDFDFMRVGGPSSPR